MEGMVVSASTGVMTSLLSKLSMLLSDQYKQLKGVRRDIESLSLELTDMNAALVTLAEREKLDVPTKVWRDKVREMAYDIEDVVDIFMHHHSQGDDKDSLFYKTARKIRKLRARFQIAGMIQDIKARVAEQSQSRDRYKVDESTSKPTVVEVDPRIHAIFEDAKNLVGIDGPRDEITKWLMEDGNDADSRKLLKVVSIVGFGGLGKTTLANQVHAKIKNEFECTAFVSVSRTPDMPKILKDILSRVGYDGSGMEDDVRKLIEMLREQLTNKRYLIIIDDIWSTKAWCTIKCSFVENNNGSRLITTTRIQEVAMACCFPSQVHVYKMQPLDEHHSKRLFFKRIFDTEDGCPKQFREISNDMLRKCKGVPLAITSIASLLANQSKNIEMWEKIHNSLGFKLETNPSLEWMRHVLSLSYNDLSHELKTCMLYLGMYPEDCEILKNDLVRKWIAEGFVMKKHSLDLEEAAENCFNELINRSMIQPCFDSFSYKVMGCQVHDLMLDLIISKCEEENFITIVDRKFTMNGASHVRRISHQFNNRDMCLTVDMISLPQVRSYNSLPEAHYMPPLCKFELLRILDMDQGWDASPGSMFIDLSAINHLFLLRYLRVSGFHLKLPKKFGKLKHLLTLDILRCRLNPSKQLSDFTALSSLRHLALPHYDGRGIALINGLGKLCNLRSLFNVHIGAYSIQSLRDLGELANLRELHVIYSEPSDVEDNLDTILATSLEKIGNNLRDLCCKAESGSRSPSTQFWVNYCLSRPRHLQRCSLARLLIHKVPNWIAYADRLVDLDLFVQELRSDDIQVLGKLPYLINLQLLAETIPDKSMIFQPNTFGSLKDANFLCLCELSCLTFEPDAMPQLRELLIQFDGCGQDEMQSQEGSPVGGIEHLANLEKISVSIRVRCGYGHRSKIESAWRDAISRHPKSHAIEIDVDLYESDENGNEDGVYSIQ